MTAVIDFLDKTTQLNDWRDRWEKVANEYFKEKGYDNFISSKSYEDRGLEKVPTRHLPRNQDSEKYKEVQEIRKDAGIESEEEFAGIVNKLGNKILLEERINRAIGNEWFRTKVSTKLENKTGYIDSQFPIASALVKKYRDVRKPYWTKEDIALATKEACDRIIGFIFGE